MTKTVTAIALAGALLLGPALPSGTASQAGWWRAICEWSPVLCR